VKNEMFSSVAHYNEKDKRGDTSGHDKKWSNDGGGDIIWFSDQSNSIE